MYRDYLYMYKALSWKKRGSEGGGTQINNCYSREKGSQLRGSFFCRKGVSASM